MHISLVVLFTTLLASAFAMLESRVELPACASTCETTSDPKPCNATDVPCLCLNLNYIAAFGTCVVTTCSLEDAQAATDGSLANCKAAGIDYENPFPNCVASSSCPTIAIPLECDITNGTCLCSNQKYIQEIDTCFGHSCTGQDLESARHVESALCRAWGVDISSIMGA